MTLELAFAITTTLLGALVLAWHCLRIRAESKPYKIPDKEMEDIVAVAAYMQEFGKTRSYTQAWRLVQEHRKDVDEAPGEKKINARRKIKNDQ